MSCDYCDKKAKYMFQDGERTCEKCLSDLPDNLRSAKIRIVELIKELDKEKGK